MGRDLNSTLLYCKVVGCLIDSLIGDAMGTLAEGKDYRDVVPVR